MSNLDANTRNTISAAMIALTTAAQALSSLIEPVQVAPVTPAPQVVSLVAPQVTVHQGGGVSYEQGKDNKTGRCFGCAKEGMVANRYCSACIKRATKAATEAAAPAPVAIDLTAFDTPAKVSNKGRKGANCQAPKCGHFTIKGTPFCGAHQTGTVLADEVEVAKAHLVEITSRPTTEGFFVTLEDEQGALRIPADKAVEMRKAGLKDAEILKASRIAGIGVPLVATPGTLV